MSRLVPSLAVVLIAIGVAASISSAQSKQPDLQLNQAAQRGAAMNLYAFQFEQMQKTLDLSDDQKSKIKEKVDAMNKELDEFRQDAVEKIREASRNAQAGGGGTEAARQQMQENIRKILDDFQKLIDTHQARINADLTPDQRVSWESYKLIRSLQQRLALADLSDDQKQQVKPLADAAAKQLAEAKDPAAAAAITGKLLKKIYSDILSDEQAGKLVNAANPALITGTTTGAAPPRNANPDKQPRNRIP